MGIDDLQLSPEFIAALYPESLVQKYDTDSKIQTRKAATLKPAIHYPFLGGNAKSICFLVSSATHEYLSAEQNAFLTKILSACKLSLNDISLINTFRHPLDLNSLKEQFRPRIIFLWGESQPQIDAQRSLPDLQVASIDNFLVVPVISAYQMTDDTPQALELKQKLWVTLKKIVYPVKLIFATNNRHKLEELQLAIGTKVEIVSLADAGIEKEIPEPYDTLKENAQIKAKTIYELSGGENCFSEDTGLSVDALDGAPGVHSARYAGEPVSYSNNTLKLLHALTGIENRRARFITTICLILDGKEYYFEGICEGEILHQPSGAAGFGYDPVFKPEGSQKSFAEMTPEEKNHFSHRRKAGDLLIAFLKIKTDSFAHGQN